MTLTRHTKMYQRPQRLEVFVDPADAPISPPTPGLPIPLTSFIGRTHEQAEVTQRLATTRLLTLIGPGGCGKTRLALVVAAPLERTYCDGVALVDLGAISDGAQLPQAIVAALNLDIDLQRSPAAALVDALRSRELLLVLDNCDYLIDDCAHLTQALLGACPRLRILATSREALGVSGETTWPVPPLSPPDPQQLDESDPNLIAELGQSEAVSLFAERAAAARPGWMLGPRNALAVAQICRRLDGLPLTIELAAARVKVLMVAQIADRLDDCLHLLTIGSRTAAPRHQSLRASIDWSYTLLSKQECTLFRRLAIFAGGWTLEAAEVVCGDQNIGDRSILDVLTRLADRSLIVVETRPDGDTRYRLLATFQQYAYERLIASGEAERARQRHTDYFLALAEASEQELRGPRQIAWLERLELEHDNLRAALQSALDSGVAETAGRLSSALWRFWWMHNDWSAGRKWLELALTMQPVGAPPLSPAVRAKALHGAGVLASEQGDFPTAQIFYERSLAIRRELGDTLGIASSLNSLGVFMRDQGDFPRARALFEESLALRRQIGSEPSITTVLSNLGQVMLDQGDYARAQTCFEETLALDQKLGDTLGIAVSTSHLARVALAQGDYVRAQSLFEEGLALSRELDDSEAIAEGLENLATVAVGQGQAARAVRLLGAAEALRETIGAPLAPAERANYERTLALAGAQLAPATFAVTWAEGRATPIDRVLAKGPDSDSAFDQPIAVRSGDELEVLTEEFNRMAGRVAELMRQQRADAQSRERIDHELRVARLIQQTLLPKELPRPQGWSLAAHYKPARAVGGDFYDFIGLPDGRLGLVIGDVTDKGVPAALVMATTRSILRGAAERVAAPGEVLERTNELLCPDIPPKMFVTCLYAVIDPPSGRIRYANAGHDLPFRRYEGGVEELRATGLPLGLMSGAHYEEQEITLAPGDSLLFYSDGAVEAHNAHREIFGFGRLRALIAQRPACDALLIGGLLHELKRFAGAGWEQEDDITLVTLQRHAM